MRPTPRSLTAAGLAVVTATALAACSSEEPATGSGEGATASSSTTAVVESSAPVPGPDGAPVQLPAPVVERWNELGGEQGALGRATGPATEVDGGRLAEFERGAIALTPAGRAFVVQGEILAAYRGEGGPAGRLGFPTSDETTTDGGWISTFENGSIAYLDGRPVVETR
jgi:hypothetical protein